MSNEIVKYHNDLNKINFTGFNEKELNVFFSIIFHCKEQGIRELTIPFSELKSLVNDKGKDRKRFQEVIINTHKKLIQLFFKLETENKITLFTLFNKLEIDLTQDLIFVKINEEFSFLLNKLVKNYTKFELIDFINLKSIYSKNLFTKLKQWANLVKKEKKFTLDEFKNLIGVQGNYERFSAFDTYVLGQLRKDLAGVIPNFKLEAKKTGRQYTHIVVTWGAGKVDNEVIEYKEDDTKEIEVSQKVIDYIKDVCKHNRFIKEVLDDEDNLINLLEKFQGKQVALVKGLEFCKKEIQKEINIEYLIKTVRTGAGVKRTKKVLKIVKDEVTVPKEVPTEQPAPTVPAEDKVEVPNVKVEETNSELAEFEKLSKEEQSKIEDIAIELYKKDNGVQANPILNMRNAKIFKNLMKKYIIQAMNGEEVLSEDKVEVEEQPIEQKEEKKVYTVEDIPADKLLSKAGKKLGGVALQARIEKILKEMNGE